MVGSAPHAHKLEDVGGGAAGAAGDDVGGLA